MKNDAKRVGEKSLSFPINGQSSQLFLEALDYFSSTPRFDLHVVHSDEIDIPSYFLVEMSGRDVAAKIIRYINSNL